MSAYKRKGLNGVWVVRRGIIKNKSAMFHPTRQGEHRQERGNWGVPITQLIIKSKPIKLVLIKLYINGVAQIDSGSITGINLCSAISICASRAKFKG